MKQNTRCLTLASIIVGLTAAATPTAALRGPNQRPKIDSGLMVGVFCLMIIREVPCGVGEIVVKTMDGVEVARQASNKTGRFQIPLKPGKYLLSAIDPPPQQMHKVEITPINGPPKPVPFSAEPKQVEVLKNEFTQVKIVYWDGRKCLSSHTKISTPHGDVSVEDVKEGMLVWTLDARGNKVASPVLKTVALLVSHAHTMLHMVFKDGRELWLSPGHPVPDGRVVGQLKLDDLYDGSSVIRTESKPYWDTKTYDLLPAGDTGVYWANGILLGSTLR